MILKKKRVCGSKPSCPFDNNTSLCMYGSATSRTNEVSWRDGLHMVLSDIGVWIDGILYVERQGLSYRIYKKKNLKIAIPYLIALVVYWGWCMFVQHTNMYDYFALQSFDKWLPYSWFIFVIMGGVLPVLSCI